ncbi:MAG: hypothetical protein EBT15_07325 [Betaproteobacteria bacterium]|nr:hypothetical protein [Betaproteobacteria bacterium]
MPENHFAELFRLVRAALEKGKREDVHSAILAAHFWDRPQGFITRETSGLVRQYRNSVSCDPTDLIQAALTYEGETENANH